MQTPPEHTADDIVQGLAQARTEVVRLANLGSATAMLALDLKTRGFDHAADAALFFASALADEIMAIEAGMPEAEAYLARAREEAAELEKLVAE